MRKYIRGNIISALQWQIHCQVYQPHAFWEIAHTTSSRNILSAIAVLTGLFFCQKHLNLWTETVTALIFVIKFTLVSIGLTTGTRTVPQVYTAGDDRPVFWSILLALLIRGHTKVLLAEPAFGLHERRLRQTPLWVSAVCKWKQPPSDNTQLQPCCYSPVVRLLCVCVQEKSG